MQLNFRPLAKILGRAKHSCKNPVVSTVNQGTNADARKLATAALTPLQTYFDFCKRSFRWHSSVMGVVGAIAITILNGAIASVQAAQTVVLRRGSLTESIELADLKILAETGTVSPNLEAGARILNPQQRSQIQDALKAKFKINAVAVDNFLNTEVGKGLSSA